MSITTQNLQDIDQDGWYLARLTGPNAMTFAMITGADISRIVEGSGSPELLRFDPVS